MGHALTLQLREICIQICGSKCQDLALLHSFLRNLKELLRALE